MRGAAQTAFRAPLTVNKPLDRAALPHYWHPDREGVEHADKSFQRELDLVSDGQVVAVRPPPGAPIKDPRWAIWYRQPRITHPLCPGWLLLFAWPPADYDPIPLDNRVIANLYMVDARRFPSARAYFDTIVASLEHDHEYRAKHDKQRVVDMSRDYFESTKIKNIGRGNKFALHHDGTILPGRAERNWLHERRHQMVPADVAKAQRDRRARARSKRRR